MEKHDTFKAGFRAALFLLLFFITETVCAQSFSTAGLEETVREVVRRVSPACVRIMGYDSVRNSATGGKFSGVVVSADGLVLTAAHATAPGRVYKLIFPDGKECVGVGLGRIGSADVAFIRITTPGNWPFSEVGWSYSLSKYQPCLSISYPGSIETNREPVIRLGYVAEPLNGSGMIRSTCLMEPGDSGGPLFDLFGRVIGIHSRIDVALDVNLEIPVDQFRTYWTALLSPVSYRGRQLPEKEPVGTDPVAGRQAAFPELADLPALFPAITSKNKEMVVAIADSDTSHISSAWGTIVTLAGAKGDRYIVSKSSLIGHTPFIRTRKGWISAEVLGRDDSCDLVLLRAAGLRKALELRPADADTLTPEDRGRFLLSVSPEGKSRVSVYAASSVPVPGRSGAGFLGVMSEQVEGKLKLSQIVMNSPAEKSLLMKGDLLEAVNGASVYSPEGLTGVLSKFRPGDKVEIRLNRNDSIFMVSVALEKRPEMGRHAADRFEEGKSARRDGFPRVFVHDAPVRPEECGGPVFDAKGELQGINIARLSRTSTLVVPYTVVYRFVEGVVK